MQTAPHTLPESELTKVFFGHVALHIDWILSISVIVYEEPIARMFLHKVVFAKYIGYYNHYSYLSGSNERSPV